MNKYSILFFLVFSISIFAQRTCGTDAKLQELIKNKPGFAKQYKAVMDYIYNPNTSKKLFSKQSSTASTVVTIPVVFHILYKNANQNISDAQIQSQLDVLNKDFRKLNTDFNTVVPNVFKPLAADVEILFCKATKKTDGTTTTGITRKSVPDTFDFDKSYYTASGEPAWDNTKYLNIWVGSLTNPKYLGFTTFSPTPRSQEDGVCISYNAFGTIGTAIDPFRKGRSTTHEIGHYLGLLHPWGKDSSLCDTSDNSDGISDTPATKNPYYDCPTFPSNANACVATSNGSMFMNYMDYVDDACMAFFTLGQKEIMRNTLAGPRLSLLSASGCGNLVEIVDVISVYPNPVSKYFTITSSLVPIDEVEVYNVLGQLVKTQKLVQTNNLIDIEDLSSGTYYLRIYNQGQFLKSDKLIKE